MTAPAVGAELAESVLRDIAVLGVVRGAVPCQVAHLLSVDPCQAEATWTARVKHQGQLGTPCAPIASSLCDEHLSMFEQALREAIAASPAPPERCRECNGAIRSVEDVIVSRWRL